MPNRSQALCSLEACPGALEELSELLAGVGSSGTLIIPINYTMATGQPYTDMGVLASLPANSLIKSRHVIRIVAWDAITTFTAGVAGDADLFVDNTQHNLTGAAPASEEVDDDVVRTAVTPVILTWDQGAATVGNGYLVIEYFVYA